MENNDKFFEASANYLYSQLIIKISKYIDSRKIFQYQLLYRDDYDNSNIENDEPFYYHNKQRAKETMSRILNLKIKLNDNIYKTICKNINENPVAFLFSLTSLYNNENEVMYIFTNDFKLLFNKILEDAFISETYFKIIINLFKDNFKFSKYILESEPNLNEDFFFNQNYLKQNSYMDDKTKRIELLNEAEFAEIFWETSMIFLNKIDSLTYNKYSYTDNLATTLFKFFESKNKLLLKLPNILEDLFIFLNRNYFSYLTPNKDNTSLGLLGYNLLKHQVKNEQENFCIETSDFDANLIVDNVNDKNWVIKKQIALSCLQFVEQISNFQEELIIQENNLSREIEERRIALFYDEEYELEANIKATTVLNLQCNECRFKNTIECDEINLHICETSSIDQAMGIRTSYQINIEKKCRHCSNLMNVSIVFDEYPQLMVDSIQLVQNSGCKVISLPQLEATIY